MRVRWRHSPHLVPVALTSALALRLAAAPRAAAHGVRPAVYGTDERGNPFVKIVQLALVQ
jgi:hypothetical protein